MQQVNTEERDEALRLADELLADIDLDRTTVDKQVLKASRLARLVGDERAVDWLSSERGGYSRDQVGNFYWRATQRGSQEEKDYIYSGAVQLAPFVHTLEDELSRMTLPNLSGEFVAVAIRETRSHIASIRNHVVRHQRVLSSVSMLIHDFASRQYHALRFASHQEGMFERAKSEIDSLLGGLDQESLRKIESAYSNLVAGDPEAIAAAMNSIRRLMDGFADVVFPPVDEPRTSPDGQQVRLGSEQRLNRVKAYIDDHAQSASRATRLKRAISDIYGRVSTGVHKEVSRTEGEHLFLATYVLLGEVLTLPGVAAERLVDVDVDVRD